MLGRRGRDRKLPILIAYAPLVGFGDKYRLHASLLGFEHLRFAEAELCLLGRILQQDVEVAAHGNRQRRAVGQRIF